MTNFTAYGINLCSNIDLPGLLRLQKGHPTTPIIRLLMGELPCWLHTTHEIGFWLEWFTSPYKDQGRPILRAWQVNWGKHFYLKYSDGIEFVIDRQGREIWANWPANLTLEDTMAYLSGPILGFALRLQGTICLHASAVVIQDKVAVFVGVPGAGKSTLAATFAQQGYSVLSDDVVALVDQGDTFLVQPAYPRIRLWQDSVEALYGSPHALPRLVPANSTWEKCYLDLTKQGYQFELRSLPVGSIYLLNSRINNLAAPLIESVLARDQLISLIANTYTNYLLDKPMRAKEFEVLGRIVEHVPLKRITPHGSPSRLPNLLNTILDDFKKLNSRKLTSFNV